MCKNLIMHCGGAFRLFFNHFYNKPYFDYYSLYKSLSFSLLSLGQIPRSATDESKSFWNLLMS